MHDPFHARDTFETGAGRVGIYRLSKLEDAGLTEIAALPYSIRVLLECVLRNCDGYQVTEDDVRRLAGLAARAAGRPSKSRFKPARGGAAGLHRRAVRGRSGGHAERDEAARRRSRSGSTRWCRSIW